jgi:hypothetical protein
VKHGDHFVPPQSCGDLRHREVHANDRVEWPENKRLISEARKRLCVGTHTPWPARRASRLHSWPDAETELL